MVSLQVDNFIFEGGLLQEQAVPAFSGSGLKITAKRYRDKGRSRLSGRNDPSRGCAVGLTLLFTHCIGAHKEQWEPTIEAIFNEVSLNKRASVREAWSFDWQSHGDAAVMNRNVLVRRPGMCVSIYEWAAAISDFVKSDRMQGHRIVAIGHSAGAGALTLSTKVLQSSPYIGLVLVEPAIVTKELFESTIDDRMDQMEFAVRMTMARRYSWSSKAAAFEWLSKRYPWSTWDTRVLRALTNHGLEDFAEGVRLKCDKLQEAASYPDVEGHFESAEILSHIHRSIPVHIIWGDNPDIIPDNIRQSLSDVSADHVAASVRFVEEAGHMVVQQKPNALARALCDILSTMSITKPLVSKL